MINSRAQIPQRRWHNDTGIADKVKRAALNQKRLGLIFAAINEGKRIND
jgi:hypothetical protein